jgi:hypothetical protein
LDTEIVGRKSGLLTVLEVLQSRKGRGILRCLCDCGREIEVRRSAFVTGHTRSCGVGHRFYEPRGPALHSYPEYRSWCAMRERCRVPKHPKFYLYGGRGIRVCARWEGDFLAFLSDMGRRPSDSHTIERINCDGNYEPGNCRWATVREQGRNKRTNRYLDMGGRRRLLIDVAADFGLHPSVLAGRLKHGWPLDRAVSAPVRPKRKNGEAPRAP